MSKELLEQYDYALDEDETIFKNINSYSCSIGEFIISFSILESSLNLLISDAINNRGHELGYIIIKNLRFIDKINLTKDLYTKYANFVSNNKLKIKTEKELKLIITKLNEINSFRNKVAHCNWGTLNKSYHVRTKIISDNTGQIEFVKFKLTTELITKYTSWCEQMRRNIDNFSNKVQDRLYNQRR